MDLHEYESSALYGELMRRGESPRYEWALHVVALDRALSILDRYSTNLGTSALEETAAIQHMLGATLSNDLIREAHRIAGMESTE